MLVRVILVRGGRMFLLFFALALVLIRFSRDVVERLSQGATGVAWVAGAISLGSLLALVWAQSGFGTSRSAVPYGIAASAAFAIALVMPLVGEWTGKAVYGQAALLSSFMLFSLGPTAGMGREASAALEALAPATRFYFTVRAFGSLGFVCAGASLALLFEGELVAPYLSSGTTFLLLAIWPERQRS
jgi:hypothetical protein